MSTEFQAAAQCLLDVLARENEALTRLDFPFAVTLVSAKEAALRTLTKHSPPALAVPSSLAILGRRLADLAAENQSLLERAIAVQTRIVQIVVRAAAPAPALTPYGGQRARTLSLRAAPMAVSTRA